MTLLFNITLVASVAALVLSCAGMASGRRTPGLLATLCIVVGTAALTGFIGWRWIEAGRAPFSDMFESLTLVAWVMMAIFLPIRMKAGIAALETAVILLVVATLAYASAFESDIKPLMPALRSNWLTGHVLACMLGYGGFAVSFLSAIGFVIYDWLVRMGAAGNAEKVRDSFESVTARTIFFGFLFLSFGIVTGSVWANVAWGSYWSWDPKETWSLITWFVYAAYLHCRFMRGWGGRLAAWIAIAGFISVLVTYFGVNYLSIMKGLHSYAQ